MCDTLIKLARVVEKAGVGKSYIYKTELFPKAIKIGPRAAAWIEREVDEWIAQRIAASRTRLDVRPS